VIPQADGSTVLLQIQVPRGELTAEQLEILSLLADTRGDGHLYFTHRQNVEIHSIKTADIDSVIASVHTAGLYTDGFLHILDAVSCVGTTFCNLAVANTPNVYRELLDTLGKRDDYRNKIHHVLINMNGCPNSCGQHKIADIGLRGMRLPSESGSVEAFELSLGGSIYDGIPRFNEPVATMPSSDCIPMIEHILDTYLAQRSSDTQPFRLFYEEKGREFFVELLAAAGCRPPKGVLTSTGGTALKELPKGHEITGFSDLLE
jgi:sulfite reductase beta subunit-like hemoprotein